MQYTQKRVADVAIDLFAIAAVLSRTTAALEQRGEEGARREIDLTTIFVAAAEKRLAENVAAFEKNDDELRKAIASAPTTMAATRSTSCSGDLNRSAETLFQRLNLPFQLLRGQ